MHVLYHHRTAGDRVEAVHILGIVRALRRLGHTVEVCSPPGCDPERKAAAGPTRAPAPAEGPVRRALKRFARKAPPVVFELAELGYNVWSLADMARRALRRRPDLVYERMTSNSVAPTLLARWWGAPVVQEVNVTTRIGRLRPLALRRLTRGIERWVARRTDVFATVSERFRRMLLEDGFPAERIVVTHSAADPEAFDPARTEAVSVPAGFGDGFVVGYVGAFVPWHRPDVLIEAVHGLGPEARLMLVGDGVERPSVEAQLEELGLAGRAWLPGAVRHDAVPRYVKAMDAAVMPHSNAFGSPMKLFEYMAMARPVVVPDVPAIAEVVRDGVNGLLFPPGDAGALAAALRRLMEEPALRERLARRARADVRERHNWTERARTVLAALERAEAKP